LIKGVPVLKDINSTKEQDKMAEQIYRAYLNGEKIPNISLINQGITSEEAYQIQKKYLAMRLDSDAICGFKAGLCTSGAQKKLDYTEPLSGILYASGNYRERSVPMYPSGRMIIETEIGLVMGRDISAHIESVAEMKEAIDNVMPAIEFPDHNFADIEHFTALDLISCNVIASGCMEGIKVPAVEYDLNNIKVSLYYENEVIDSGIGSNTWKNDQWESARWLVNSIIDHGYVIKKGSFLLTGALGSMVTARKGSYRADYGKLGRIEFDIV